MTALVPTKAKDLKAGMTVEFYGARFEIQDDSKTYDKEGSDTPVTRVTGKWVSGAVVPCYFGPDKDWVFQGNELAHWAVVQA